MINMDIRFDGKRALVTGAGKGIGRGMAKALAQCGAKTYALSRTKEDLETLKQEVAGIEIVSVDLMDWDATRKAVEDIGPIDLLVNNAGTHVSQPFLEVTRKDLDLVVGLNLKAVFNVSQVVCKGMVERGTGGSVVNISSQASKIALQNHAAYAASKGGMDSLTKVMALELGPHKIRVNAVNPTIIMTPLGRKHWSAPEKAGPQLALTPIGRFGEVEDVTNVVLFLLSDKAAMVHGSTVPIDGGRIIN